GPALRPSLALPQARLQTLFPTPVRRIAAAPARPFLALLSRQKFRAPPPPRQGTRLGAAWSGTRQKTGGQAVFAQERTAWALPGAARSVSPGPHHRCPSARTRESPLRRCFPRAARTTRAARLSQENRGMPGGWIETRFCARLHRAATRSRGP